MWELIHHHCYWKNNLEKKNTFTDFFLGQLRAFCPFYKNILDFDNYWPSKKVYTVVMVISSRMDLDTLACWAICY